jgi:hypothetical protein
MANTHTADKATSSGNADELLRAEAETAQGLLDHLKEYAREKPEVAALWCLGIGFILGWKLKPW